MTVEVNFSTETGFSYIILKIGADVPVKMDYHGPDEEESSKYKVDNENIYKKIDRKIFGNNPASVDKASFGKQGGNAALMFRAESIKEAHKVKDRVGKVYGSFYGGVEIDGLHEDRMLNHWRTTDRNSADFFKGSAFGWAKDYDRTSHSVVARLLAVGLPDRLKGRVSIGVKSKWSAHDVQVYAETIWHKMH